MNKPSHIRGLLKGFTWRIIATSDTILIVLFITCVFGKCSIENALKIGVLEFLIKIIIFYFHENLWIKVLDKQANSRKELILKTVSWRFIATLTTFIISGIILSSFSTIAILIASIEVISKLILYYIHEKIWLKIPLGKFFVKK